MRDAGQNEPVDDLLDALCGVRKQCSRKARLGAALRPCLQPLFGQNPVGHRDLLLFGGRRRVAHTAVLGPGGRLELQAAVLAVSGVGCPVSTGLALRDCVPVGGRGGSVGNSCRRTQRRCDKTARKGGLYERFAELSHVKYFAGRVPSVTDLNGSRDKKSMARKSACQKANYSLLEPNL